MTQGNLRYGANNNEANDPTVLTGTVTENLPNRRAAFTVRNRTGNNASAGGAIVGEVGTDPGETNDAPAVEGFNGDGDGVQGTSGAHSGVRGIGPIGVTGEARGAGGAFDGPYGVLGQTPVGTGPRSAGVVAYNGGSGPGIDAFSNQGPAGRFNGALWVYGQLYVLPAGGKHSVLRHPDGSHRLMYCLEGTEAWLEDFGRDVLSDGRAQVDLDADYAALIEPTDYFVFLSPEGDSGGLYVSDRRSTGFIVQEQGGGRSTTPFSYRVVARPQGGDKQRLAALSEDDIAPREFTPPGETRIDG